MLAAVVAMALMIVALGFLSDKFLTPDNGWNILRQIAVNLCLSIGMTLVIVSGGRLTTRTAGAVDCVDPTVACDAARERA